MRTPAVILVDEPHRGPTGTLLIHAGTRTISAENVGATMLDTIENALQASRKHGARFGTVDGSRMSIGVGQFINSEWTPNPESE